jgi:protein-tyrosine phosphatase
MDESPRHAPPRLLAAAPNFRDIGGLRGAGGGVVRRRQVYRSGALDQLLDEDLARLASFGLGLCCDLRTAAERQQSPSRWPPGAAPRLLELEFASDIRALSPERMLALIQAPGADKARQLMLGLYCGMPITCAPLLARLLPELADAPDALPVVIHCTAGKDRTGFVVAVLLSVLGVAEADIRADYLHSNHSAGELRRNAKVQVLLEQLLGAKPDPHAVQALTSALPDYLDAALGEVRRAHGSVERYLAAASGVDAGLQERLRRRLLEPAARG